MTCILPGSVATQTLFLPLALIPSKAPDLATDSLDFARFCRHADIIFAIGTHSFRSTRLWRQIACIHIQMINVLKFRNTLEFWIRHNVSDEAGAGAESSDTTLDAKASRQRLTARHGRPSAAPAARHRCWAASPARGTYDQSQSEARRHLSGIARAFA